jgi:AcrR family transcriptional regulator
MPKVSKAHSESRRRQIMEAAVDCFSKHGFDGTTMRDIVRASNLSAGAIYIYFASKGDIIEEIARERHARERAAITDALEQADPMDFFGSLAEGFFGTLRDKNERKMRRLGVQLWAEALRNPRLLRIVQKGIDGPRTTIAQFVARAQQTAHFPLGLEPDAVARVLIAMFQGFILQQAWNDRTEIAPFVAVARAAFDAIVNQSRQRS